MRGYGVKTRLGCAALGIGLLLAAGAAHAHDVAADLSVWGNFQPQVARCQRSVARAATLCVSGALAARNGCASAQLTGEPCDSAAVDARIQAVRQRARDLVARSCQPTELLTLRYIDLADAQTDVIDVCRQLETAAVSAAYNPAMLGGSIAAMPEPADAECVETTARAGSALLRYAARARQRALDTIASTAMLRAEKLALIARSARAIDRAESLMKARVQYDCPGNSFEDLYGRSIETVLAGIAGRADYLAQQTYVQNAVVATPPVCGDGMQIVPSEECDDGNDYAGDGCTDTCTKTDCTVFPTTYDLIQKAIFENHGCTSDVCHGSAAAGGLDLRAGNSYAEINDVDSATVPGMKRVDPGNKDESLLWINVAALTRPAEFTAPLRGMPLGLPALSEDELEALGKWIETGGAARDAQIPEAAALLNACVPEPEPVKIDPLEPPPAGTGVQFHMPLWTLGPKSESEVCYASYYDVTDQVPAQFRSTDGLRFRYKSVEIRQDPLSHHLIVDVFNGPNPPNDPEWGVYHCLGGERAGEVCDPLDLSFCGTGQCATDPDSSAVACVGFGPTTGLGSLGSGGFAFAQETTALFRYPDQVYDELPLKGVLLWNSHAFNLTKKAGTLEAWINLDFPAPEEQDFPAQQIFDASKIFWNANFPPFPLPQLMPFEDMEVCQFHEFGPNQTMGGSLLKPSETAHLFELSGHMHKHGKRFQIFRGRFACSGGSNAGAACSPEQPEMCPAAACVDAGGRNPDQALLYTNYVYNDPIILRFPEPLLIDGSAPLADRTLTYCGHYDNGTAPKFDEVKRRSTSPEAGLIFGIPIGGPCPQNETRCIGGPNHNQLCNGDNAACDSSSGAGDGDCDACPLTGGFRTQDEMFILFGNYWVTD
jgi:cysteine-rich repeat protein